VKENDNMKLFRSRLGPIQLGPILLAALPVLLMALPALAQTAATGAPAAAPPPAPPPKLDSGDTAWMLTSTALVLMMTVPGLFLFYAGMVRKKNLLATVMQSFAITCLVTICWWAVGYSIAFTDGGPYLGDFSRVMLNGMGAAFDKGSDLAPTIPESVYMMFQMTFAIITPALICGSFADRMKFSAMCVFMVAWSILIYCPIAHWAWSANGWEAGLGLEDYAGGTVVHINAGIAGLMTALVLGKRAGYGTDNMAPYNVSYAVIGASLLWVGWFGFNAGSAVTSGPRAGMAMTVTQIATAAAALGWMFAEWITKGKPSVLGIASGAVAGLVAITPASGFVLPTPAVIIGVVAGVGCFFASTSMKHAFGYDDSLDTFGVHCIGGIIGALLTGVFAYDKFVAAPQLAGGFAQLKIQAMGVGVTLLYSGIGSLILLKIIDAVIGLRVTPEEEREGLDISLHGEQMG
jgi:Amt family ammonium transporter